MHCLHHVLLLTLRLPGKEVSEEGVDIRPGRGLHDLPQGLAVPVEAQGRDTADLLPFPDALKLVHVHLHRRQHIRIFRGNVIIGPGNPAAVPAPGGPEVHQHHVMTCQQLMQLLLRDIPRSHILPLPSQASCFDYTAFHCRRNTILRRKTAAPLRKRPKQVISRRWR